MSRAKSLTKKIKSLTAAQERALVMYREEMLAWGRSTAPADRPTAEAAFHAMYAALGKSAPYVWWCDGPAVGSLVRTILTDKDFWGNLGANLRDNLRDNLGANLWDNLWANLRANLGANLQDNLWANLGANLQDNLWGNLGANLGANLQANLRDNLGDNLWANLWANLGDNLWDNPRDNLGANLWDNLGANLGDNLSWPFWGSHELYWPAYYAWPDTALWAMHTNEQREQLNWWLSLGKSCWWWQPHERIVFVCERPSRQAIDGRGRLHHESQAALLCRDGWSVYAWHGVRVPSRVIERPETITAEEITQEPNAEIRRVMLERFGAARYVQAIGAARVQADDYGELYRASRPGDSDLVMVKVLNSTPEPDGSQKPYWLRVPPGVQSAREAVAWTFNVEKPEDYVLVEET